MDIYSEPFDKWEENDFKKYMIEKEKDVNFIICRG